MPLIKSSRGRLSGTRSAARFRSALAVTQIAISLMLLAGAGLFTGSLHNIGRIDTGMKVGNLVSFSVSPSRNGYAHAHSLRLYERLEDGLRSLPGVTGVTDSWVRLLSNATFGENITLENLPKGMDSDTFSRYNRIGPDYFHTLGIPLISGREFTRSDAAASPEVAIVNEAFVEKFNLGRNAIGRHIGSERSGSLSGIEIVGIAKNSRYSNIREIQEPVYYVPYRQADPIEQLTFYVRTSSNPERLFPAVKKLMAQLDANLPVENLRTMQDQVREQAATNRLLSSLATVFSGLAILLASVGLYGVIAYTVTQRTREIGLRIALGATGSQVREMVLRQVGRICLPGCAIGLVLAIGFGRLAQSSLYRMQGYSAVIFVGSTLVLLFVALAAGFIPAYRASRIDPMQALRYE